MGIQGLMMLNRHVVKATAAASRPEMRKRRWCQWEMRDSSEVISFCLERESFFHQSRSPWRASACFWTCSTCVLACSTWACACWTRGWISFGFAWAIRLIVWSAFSIDAIAGRVSTTDGLGAAHPTRQKIAETAMICRAFISRGGTSSRGNSRKWAW